MSDPIHFYSNGPKDINIYYCPAVELAYNINAVEINYCEEPFRFAIKKLGSKTSLLIPLENIKKFVEKNIGKQGVKFSNFKDHCSEDNMRFVTRNKSSKAFIELKNANPIDLSNIFVQIEKDSHVLCNHQSLSIAVDLGKGQASMLKLSAKHKYIPIK